MYNRNLGKQGESMVEAYLEELGYEFVDRNFSRKSGEVDLIIMDPEHGELVFIEIKTRRSNKFGHPEEAVTGAKLRKIEKTAQAWLQSHKKLDFPWRIDIIALELNEKPKITHLKNVTI